MRHVDDLGEGDPVRSRELGLVGHRLSGERPLEVLAPRGVHVGRHDLVDPAADDLAARAREPDLVGPVDELEHLAAVDVGDQHGQGVGDGAQPFPALDRFLLGLFPFGDVAVGADQGDRLAVLVPFDLGERPDPADGAVARANDPVLRSVGRRIAGEDLEEVADGALAVLGVDARDPGLVGLDRRVPGQSVDSQIFRRAIAGEAAVDVDAHAADAPDLLNPLKLELALPQPFQHAPAIRGVADGDADAAVEGKRRDLVPAARGPGRKGFERLLLAVGHHLAVAPFELASDDGGRDLPEQPSDHLVAPEAEHVLGGAVEGGEAPIRVEGEEAFGDPVQDLLDDRPAFGRDAGQIRQGSRDGLFGRRSISAHQRSPRLDRRPSRSKELVP